MSVPYAETNTQGLVLSTPCKLMIINTMQSSIGKMNLTGLKLASFCTVIFQSVYYGVNSPRCSVCAM